MSALALATPAPLLVLPVLALLALAVAKPLSRRWPSAPSMSDCSAPALADSGSSHSNTTAPAATAGVALVGRGTGQADGHAPDAGRRSMRISSGPIYVEDTCTVCGRGVFAARDIAQGEIIEVAPVTLMAAGDGVPPEIRALVFSWRPVANGPMYWALAHGYGSLFNHANPANAKYVCDTFRSEIRYIALRDIAQGEEVTVNYNNGSTGVDDEEKTGQGWFTSHGVALSTAPERVRP